jgi:hypothetical protein
MMGSSSMKIAAKGKETEVVMQWNSSDILARALSSRRYYFKAMPSRHDPDGFGNLLKMLSYPFFSTTYMSTPGKFIMLVADRVSPRCMT